ncbi:MAG: pyruvate formate lyase 1-activating protein, partial [Clostridium sp.]|nr:pyruvate formate lyase 1-activating protein [Clostridium sp.]
HVLVPGGSDNDEQLIKLDEFIKTLDNVDRVEVLPYHSLGTFKWEELGRDYPLKDVEPPTKERIENANELLHTSEYKGYLSR